MVKIQVARAQAAKVDPQRIQVANIYTQHMAGARRIQVASMGFAHPAPGAVQIQLSRISAVKSGSVTPRRIQVSRLAAQVGARRIQISRLTAANTVAVTLENKSAVRALSATLITANFPGAVDEWDFQQTSGPTVEFVGTGNIRAFYAPATLEGATLTFKVRARIGATWSSYAFTNIVVSRNPLWVEVDGDALEPLYLGALANLPSGGGGGPVDPPEPPGNATPGLPFKLPGGLASSPKKVFAHYFGPFPISIDNATYANDYYTKAWNPPDRHVADGTGKFYDQYGGYFRGRPQSRPPITGSWAYEDRKTDIRQARAAGLDGFFVDMLGLSGNNWQQYRDLANAASEMYPDGSFSIVPMVDANGATGAATPEQAAQQIAWFATKVSGYRLPSPDNRFVVSCFAGDNKALSWWQAVFQVMRDTYSVEPAFINVLLNYNKAASYAAINYGSSAWGYGADPNIITKASNLASQARGRGEKWMAPIVPQDIRARNSLFDEACNTESLRAGWIRAIGENADYVQLVTWSDYSEGTEVNVGNASGWVNLDLSSYYLARWKTGSYPQILRDCIYLSHRNQPWTPSPGDPETNITPLSSPAQTLRMKHWPRGANATPVRNTVEILTMLTAAADVTVVIGGVTRTYSAPAGINAQLFPLAAGTISASAVRSAAVVAQITSPVTVTNAPVVDDMGYYRFSSLRGTAGQGVWNALQPGNQAQPLT